MAIIKSKGNVDACPVTKDSWISRAGLKKADCGGGTVYHCLTDSNNNKWEKCLEKTLILEGNCPMFTSDGYLDWKPCNISEAFCPNSSYFSNEVYKHPWCFGNNTPTRQTSSNSPDHGRDGPSLALTIGIVAIVVLLILVTVLIYKALRFWRKRKATEKNMKDHIDMKPLLKVEPTRGMEYTQKIAKDIISELSKEDVNFVLVTGEMDHFMVSKARDLLEKCAKELKKKPKEYMFPEIPSTTVKGNTLIFTYGWFGLLNDDLCSLDIAKHVCKVLTKICQSKPTVKVAIGMSQKMYLKYVANLESPLFSKCKHIAIKNSDLTTDYEDFFKTVKQNCEVDQCPCSGLNSDMLKSDEYENLIGMPLKVEIISKYHDPQIIRSFIEKRDILSAMTDHLTALAQNDRPIYEWLMYICLKGYFSRHQSFDKELVKKIIFEIKLSTFDEHFEKLKQFVRVWHQKYVFWHPFIYICAFHSLFKTNKGIVMNHCRVDAILQLVRPKSMKLSYVEVAADDSDIKMFKNRLLKLGLTNKYKDHPLLNYEV
ncbi:uncharacterized protein LOC111133377 isoform X3 [Crassostrea virginica]